MERNTFDTSSQADQATVELARPGVDGLIEVVRSLRTWQNDVTPMQLHPGDLGWHWSSGAEATADAVWIWIRHGQILAVGLLDGPELLRVAIAPHAGHDEVLAQQMLADVTRPERGVLPEGGASIEARFGPRFRGLLTDVGWQIDEPWTPLRRKLAEPVPDCGLRIEIAGAELADVRVAVQRAAFDNSTFSLERWHAMAAGAAYVDARCLVAYNDENVAVAAVTVWSAGPARPGLLEPLGVHREHRGRGYGTAITIAAASVLRELGSSSATVCTRSSNVGAVETYKSAGFHQFPDERDLRRKA